MRSRHGEGLLSKKGDTENQSRKMELHQAKKRLCSKGNIEQSEERTDRKNVFENCTSDEELICRM